MSAERECEGARMQGIRSCTLALLPPRTLALSYPDNTP